MQKTDWQQHIQQTLRDHQIHTIRVCIHDNSNVPRSRYIPVRHFLETVMRDHVSFPSVVFSMDTSAKIQPAAGTGFTGGYPSWILKPDLSTFGTLPYTPGMARVIADIFEGDGTPIEAAPRHVLRKVLQEFEREGYRVKGAFEYEFYVFRQSETGLEPVWNGLQCFSEIKQAQVEDILTSLLSSLSELGAGPEVANTEYGSGQFEVTHSPFWGMEIADMAFYYRTSIKEILYKKGYLATFMSKPINNNSGSGAHLNHSIYDESGKNLFTDPDQPDGLTDLCRWFIGGQLHHARTLCALTNQTVNSYKRLQPYSFAPTTATWGYEHRGAMIRVPHARGTQARLENRLPGADTNPYVALAAMLAAGLDGIRKRIEPSAALSNQDAYLTGKHLPRSLPEALATLEQDVWFRDVLGESFIRQTLALRQSECERYLAHVSDWELNEYLNLF